MKAAQALALTICLLCLKLSQSRRLAAGEWRDDKRRKRNGSESSRIDRIPSGPAPPTRLTHTLSNTHTTESMTCPSGSYNDPESGSCQPCPLGSFASNPGSDQCTLCPSGSYAPVTGSTFCLACDPSYYDGLGSDYGYSVTSTSSSAADSRTTTSDNATIDVDDVVYCVAPLYPDNTTDDWTESTESPTSLFPSAVPTMAPSALTSSSPPSDVPTMGGPSEVPTSTTAPTSSPTHNRRPPTLHHPWPWHPPHSPTPSPDGSHTATPHPTVRRRWNFSEGARGNRTDGTGEDGDKEDSSQNFRPFLPLLALSAALTLSAVAFAFKVYRRQQQERRQLVVKTYSSRPSALPLSTKPHDPMSPAPPPPPPHLRPPSPSSSLLSKCSFLQEVESDSSDYWSTGSPHEIEGCSSHGESSSSLDYESSYEDGTDDDTEG